MLDLASLSRKSHATEKSWSEAVPLKRDTWPAMCVAKVGVARLLRLETVDSCVYAENDGILRFGSLVRFLLFPGGVLKYPNSANGCFEVMRCGSCVELGYCVTNCSVWDVITCSGSDGVAQDAEAEPETRGRKSSSQPVYYTAVQAASLPAKTLSGGAAAVLLPSFVGLQSQKLGWRRRPCQRRSGAHYALPTVFGRAGGDTR